MENATYDPNSVSNISSFSTLPDFLTEMALTVLTLRSRRQSRYFINLTSLTQGDEEHVIYNK